MRMLGLSLALLAVASCNLQLGQETRGEFGRVSFYYSSGTGCFFGCGLDKPMLRGTTERFFAKGPSGIRTATFSVEPIDPIQVTDGAFSFDDQGSMYRAFDVSAVIVGDSQFSLVAADGETIDRVMLRVRDAARLKAEWALYNRNHGPTEQDWSSSSVIQLSATDAYLRISAFDSTGQQLQAARGVTISVSDSRIVAVMSPDMDTSWLVLHPLASGNATLTVTTNNGVSTQSAVAVQ